LQGGKGVGSRFGKIELMVGSVRAREWDQGELCSVDNDLAGLGGGEDARVDPREAAFALNRAVGR
jgi:hypothetical protein